MVQDETRRKVSLGRETVVDTGLPWRREILSKTGLAEALFELATAK